MAAPFLFLAALGAAQPAGLPQPQSTGHFRAFISPMGEPFRATGTDGLSVWFGQADGNHDGILTIDEFREDAQRFFLKLDTNRDGEIDPDEILHYETVIAPEVRTGSRMDGQYADDEATGGGRLGLLTIPEPVASADSNLNRGVSEQEFQVAAEKRFRLLDRAGTGRLTLDQLQSVGSAVRANARRPRRDPNEPAERPEMPTSNVPTMGRPGG